MFAEFTLTLSIFGVYIHCTFILHEMFHMPKKRGYANSSMSVKLVDALEQLDKLQKEQQQRHDQLIAAMNDKYNNEILKLNKQRNAIATKLNTIYNQKMHAIEQKRKEISQELQKQRLNLTGNINTLELTVVKSLLLQEKLHNVEQSLTQLVAGKFGILRQLQHSLIKLSNSITFTYNMDFEYNLNNVCENINVTNQIHNVNVYRCENCLSHFHSTNALTNHQISCHTGTKIYISLSLMFAQSHKYHDEFR